MIKNVEEFTNETGIQLIRLPEKEIIRKKVKKLKQNSKKQT